MGLRGNKLVLSGLVLVLCTCFASAQGLKLDSVEYKVDGVTRSDALDRTLDIDSDKRFESEDELVSYVESLKTRLVNLRIFDQVDISYTINASDSDESTSPQKVSLLIEVADSKHLLVMPYPKYDSNSGFSFKIKAKDTNFVGTMEELNADLYFETDRSDADVSVIEKTIGGDFSYSFPFQAGPILFKWNNDDSFSYTFDKSKPEYSFTTGISGNLEFGETASISMVVNQGLSRNFSYTDLEDELYGFTLTKISVPLVFGRDKLISPVTIAPYIRNASYYDSDGISVENPDIEGFTVAGGVSFDFGGINWLGNFREGITTYADADIGYCFDRKYLVSAVTANITAFKSFKHAGIGSRVSFFAMNNTQKEFGSLLRGIPNVLYYNEYKNAWNRRVSSVNAQYGIVCNIDVPVHVFTTNFLRMFDFEFQLSPFADIALVNNLQTKRVFNPADGYYASGIEFLVYPLKWKSIVVRGSVGFDLGQVFNFESGSAKNMDKYGNASESYEIFIGIGWHY